MTFSLTELIAFLIIYQTTLFVIFLLFNKKAKPLFIKVLIGICGMIMIHFASMSFNNFGLPDNVVLGPFFGLLYGPAYFFFTKSLIFEDMRLRTVIAHGAPSIIYCLLLMYFGDQIEANVNIIGVIVTIHFGMYLLLSLRLLYRYRELLKDSLSFFKRINLAWLEFIIYVQTIILIVALVEGFIQLSEYAEFLIILIYILTLILINCFYYLGLKHVSRFTGISETSIESPSISEYSISPELTKEFLAKLNNYIETDKPYLEYDISLSEMASATGISSRNLSYLINKEFGKNFYEFINGYRIEEAKKLLVAGTIPIKEVMFESGFSNKATFNTIFRKYLNTTPTQYRAKNK